MRLLAPLERHHLAASRSPTGVMWPNCRPKARSTRMKREWQRCMQRVAAGGGHERSFGARAAAMASNTRELTVLNSECHRGLSSRRDPPSNGSIKRRLRDDEQTTATRAGPARSPARQIVGNLPANQPVARPEQLGADAPGQPVALTGCAQSHASCGPGAIGVARRECGRRPRSGPSPPAPCCAPARPPHPG